MGQKILKGNIVVPIDDLNREQTTTGIENNVRGFVFPNVGAMKHQNGTDLKTSFRDVNVNRTKFVGVFDMPTGIVRQKFVRITLVNLVVVRGWYPVSLCGVCVVCVV